MKTVDFSEINLACDLKVGRCRKLHVTEIMKICEYLRSMSLIFLTLARDHLLVKIKTCFSQKPLGRFQPNFVCKLLGTMK